MKRKLLAVLLVLAMLCPMILTGCGNKSGDDTDTDAPGETSTRETVSINMYVVTDKNTTDEAKAQVEAAFNAITKATYTTSVDLIFLTEDEYFDTLMAKFKAVEEAKAAGEDITEKATETATSDEKETEEEMVTNEYGVRVLRYPEIPDDQVDIVYIQGYDQLTQLADAGYLVDLDEHLSATGASKILNDVIPSALFTYSKVNKNTYAVPNNRVIGEYTYLLVNKELVTGDANGDGVTDGGEIRGTYLNMDDIASASDYKTQLGQIKTLAEYVKANRTDMVPILEKFDNPFIKYWSEDGDFSILASAKEKVYQTSSDNRIYSMRNVFALSEFTEYELMMKKYTQDGGYFAKDAEAAKKDMNFGVALMTGDSRIIEEYGDKYYACVLRYPELTEDNLFDSYFGVSAFTGNLDRAMEVITMLNTNSELRNVLQYGVEGTHYELDDDGGVYRFNRDYLMDLQKTGNVFVAYPEETMDQDVWVRGVQTNLDMRINNLLGLRGAWQAVNPELIENLAKASREFKDRMDACTTVDELSAFFDAAKAEVAENAAYVAATSSEDKSSQYSVYYDWHYTNWPAEDA